MMDGESIYGETDYFRGFPAPEEVFAKRVEEHAEYLLPVGMLELGHLSLDWHGKLPLVLPVEPVGGFGVISEYPSQYHNYLCRPNFIGYRLLGDKCELACDLRFFHRAWYAENPPTERIHQLEMEEIPQHYEDTRRIFASHARFYREHGYLVNSPQEWNKEYEVTQWNRRSMVRAMGRDSNWWNLDSFPRTTTANGSVYPLTEDGRPFHFICEVEMWNFIGDTNGVLVVFYDPQEQIMLTTFEWT